MNKAAILHIPKSQFAFAYKVNELRLRLRTAKNDINGAQVIYAVKYDWLIDRHTAKMEKSFSDALYDYYTVSLSVTDSRIGYIFVIESGDGDYYFSEEGLTKEYDHIKSYYNFFQFPYINKSDLLNKDDWCDSAVFYQIFVERFNLGDHLKDKSYIDKKWKDIPTAKGFHGGDLAGITEKLDYLEFLGVNGIYLTPIFSSPSNHKYDTVDYYAIDDMFGSKDDLKKLVDRAHRKGIRVLLDAVFNHSSSLCAQFQDVVAKGRESEYFDWFFIHGDKPDINEMNYERFAACSYMPKWNTNNPKVQDYLIEVALYWLKEYGIDGWRLDVADEVSHEFWRKFRKAVKDANPSALIIGENWHDARPWLGGDQFDSIMNYSFTKACLDFFAFDRYDAKQFCDRLGEVLMRNTDQVNEMMLNLLDSHDTERFLTNVGGSKAKLKCALAVLFFFTGIPCVYYGTEIGMTGGYDPDSRKAFDWNDKEWDRDILQTVRQLIDLKKTKIRGEITLKARGKLVVITRGGCTLIVNNTDTRRRFNNNGEFIGVAPYDYKILYKGGKV